MRDCVAQVFAVKSNNKMVEKQNRRGLFLTFMDPERAYRRLNMDE